MTKMATPSTSSAAASLNNAVYHYLVEAGFSAAASALKKAMKVKKVEPASYNLLTLVEKKGEDKKDDASDSDSSSSSDSSDSESDDEEEKKVEKKKEESSSSDESSSDDDSSSDEEEEKETKKPVTKKKADSSSSDSDSSSSDSDDDDEDEKTDTKKKADDDEGSSGSSSDSSSSDSDSDDDDDKMDVEEKKSESKKRKADDDDEAESSSTKKAKATEPKTLFVGGLSWNVDEDMLYNFFGENGFEAGNVRIITDRESGRSKGFGYADFTDSAVADKCLEAMNGKKLDGRELRLDESVQKPKTNDNNRGGDRRSDRPMSAPSTTIFVGNLSFQAGNKELGEHFGDCEGIKGVRVATDRDSGESKGFGYVEFNNIDEAKTAMDVMKGSNFDGRALRLDYAEVRDNSRSPRGGARGGGRGGARGGGRGGARGGRGRSPAPGGTRMSF